MKKLVVGILAHVDAGKTTLSEGLLYLSGKIRKFGRVDNKDTFLDTYELEKARGITIFSKQAVFNLGETEITLLDTPGHVDFSAEMERTLQVLDYAILVISGSEGIQGHTKTLWRLLKLYRIPVFIFVNKIDQGKTDKVELMASLKKELDEGCISFEDEQSELYDQLAMCDEEVMEEYLETGAISDDDITGMIRCREVFPVFFGSALRQTGIEEFAKGLSKYSVPPSYSDEFGARVFKITRDAQGNRLTHMKITGGSLKVKDAFSHNDTEEKINQIRIYSGDKFEALGEVSAGTVCAVTGLTFTRPGDGLGNLKDSSSPILEPVLSYTLVLPEGVDERMVLPKLKILEEEEPELRIYWNEIHKEINVQIMGEVQLEILKSQILERYDIDVEFGEGKIVYKETITDIVEGVGHFEPLRHYAEVHLLLQPGERGSGLKYDIKCSEDILDRNWQRLVLTHLNEKDHLGVLTGSHLTDVRITLVSGRAHNKHTDGGDFREATFRAVRQGLMEATSVLLEPYYDFTLELPEVLVGRAMTDIDKMNGTCMITHTDGEIAQLVGSAPVSTMRNYQKEVTAYTKGLGRLFVSVKGYDICHNTEEITQMIGYDPNRDLINTASSVFCTQGSGFIVPWDQVKKHMHVDSVLKPSNKVENEAEVYVHDDYEDDFISLEEIDHIMNSTFYANQGRKNMWKKRKTARDSYYDSVTYSGSSRGEYVPKPRIKKDGEEYLLVDGYNIIFAWDNLNDIARDNMDAARTKLMDILSNYQGIKKCKIIVVFDAYRVEGRKEDILNYHNIHVVYTGEAQTADQYIEKFAYSNQEKHNITVATSDGLQQIIIRGAGCDLLSARELKQVVEDSLENMKKDHLDNQIVEKSRLEDILSDEEKEKLKQITRE